MDRLRKMVEKRVLIRGELRGSLWLQLNFFLGTDKFKDANGKGFFKVHCVLDYQSDSGTFWYEPALSVETYDDFGAMYDKELFNWRDRGGNVCEEPCMILNDMRSSVEIPNNHIQLLQALAYLCSELHAKSYELACEGAMPLEERAYSLLGHRLEGYVQACNREFLKIMRMRPLK